MVPLVPRFKYAYLPDVLGISPNDSLLFFECFALGSQAKEPRCIQYSIHFNSINFKECKELFAPARRKSKVHQAPALLR